MNLLDLERHAAQTALQDLSLEGLCLAFDGLLRRWVPYDVAAWSTQDPATGLFTSCTVTGLPKDLEREAAFFRHEFDDDEPATFRSLIAARTTVAVLSQVTEGQLERARRYRELLAPYGASDELRIVLWGDDRPWGSAVLYRGAGRFGGDDATLATTISRPAGHGIRLALLRAAATRPEAISEPPGVLSVAPDGEVTAVTEPGQRWLEEVGAGLVTAANAVAAAVRAQESWEGATSRLSLPDGRLVSLHAARSSTGDGLVAVIVDAARPAQVSEMLVDAYALTPRQREVLGVLLLGWPLPRIARELGISQHTVNDHRKAIYQRLGVSSRSELAALLQTEHYDPRTSAGHHPSPYGGFLTR